ncbi:MAG: Sua5/YciO/YrdC/YwlC family protein, partial [Bacteroidota bacterium]
MSTEEGSVALRVQVRGRVQGVGFRPHAARLAQQTGVSGWVRNGPAGVEIVVEGAAGATEAFVQRLTGEPPPAAVLNQVEITPIPPEGHITFAILRSEDAAALTVPIAPDLATCSACLVELRDPASRFYGYPFLNCTQCGPRYTVVEALPYDRPHTTLAAWPMCGACTAEYADPQDRRYHAQPTACPRCGPGVHLVIDGTTMAEGADAIAQTATLLRDGDIVAVKGLGGYLLACDAQHAEALEALRTRKGRREKPFALMARSLAEARRWVRLTPATEALLTEPARPIVLLPPTKDAVLPDAVAPGRDELGLMLP